MTTENKENESNQIERIWINGFLIKVFNNSPFLTKKQLILFCSKCLDYFDSKLELVNHSKTCNFKLKNLKHSQEDLQIFKLDGDSNTTFCQNLSLLAKLFLNEKTVFFDVAPFDFYILQSQSQTLAYFSKEKFSFERYNLACLLVLPPYRNKGLGKLLIEYSYLLSNQDGLIGGPERPLSPSGRKIYMKHWTSILLKYCLNNQYTTLGQLSISTGIDCRDILDCFSEIGMLERWDGNTLCIPRDLIKQYITTNNIKFDRHRLILAE